MSHWPNNTTSIITVIVGVVFLSGCTTRRREPTEFERKLANAFQKEPGEFIPRSWLLEELSDEAIASDPRVTPEARRMLQSRLPGDRVFFYRSPPETWAALLGRGGFAIVRDGSSRHRGCGTQAVIFEEIVGSMTVPANQGAAGVRDSEAVVASPLQFKGLVPPQSTATEDGCAGPLSLGP